MYHLQCSRWLVKLLGKKNSGINWFQWFFYWLLLILIIFFKKKSFFPWKLHNSISLFFFLFFYLKIGITFKEIFFSIIILITILIGIFRYPNCISRNKRTGSITLSRWIFMFITSWSMIVANQTKTLILFPKVTSMNFPQDSGWKLEIRHRAHLCITSNINAMGNNKELFIYSIRSSIINPHMK